MSPRAKIMAITPMSCVLIYLFLGFQFGLWLEALPVFLLIPLMPVFLGYKKLRLSIPLIITIIYLILGFGFDYWHPGWIIFLMIPILQILTSPSKKGRFFDFRSKKDITIEDDEV